MILITCGATLQTLDRKAKQYFTNTLLEKATPKIALDCGYRNAAYHAKDVSQDSVLDTLEILDRAKRPEFESKTQNWNAHRIEHEEFEFRGDPLEALPNGS